MLWASLLFAFTTANAGAQPNLLVGPTSVEFVAADAVTQPAPQTVFLASSGDPLSFEARAGYWSTTTNWLSVAPASGATPSTLSLRVDASDLAKGVYFGYLEITFGAAKPAILNVTLRVGGSAAEDAPAAHVDHSLNAREHRARTPILASSPESLTFSYQTGSGAPLPQSVFAGAERASAEFTATSSANWLWLTTNSPMAPGQVVSGKTGSYLHVFANPYGLSAGKHSSSILLSVPGGGERVLPVTINVGDDAHLVADPPALTFARPRDKSVPSPQTVTISSTGRILNYTASSVAGAWLAVGPQSGSTSGSSNTIAVAVDPASLRAGARYGSISVTAPGAAEVLTIPITIANSQAAGISIDKTTVALQGPLTGPPQTQSLQLTSSATTEAYSATTLSSIDGWLSVSPSTGSTPATLVVTADPSVLPSPGTYTGYVDIFGSQGGDEQLVFVNYTVAGGSAITLTPSPSSVSFSQTSGGSAPSPQTVQLSSSAPTSFAAAPTVPWLTVTPSNGATPGTLTLTVNATGLAAQTYQGSITIVGGGTQISVPVTFTVTSGGSGAINATPSSVSFSQVLGGAAPGTQTVRLSSSNSTSFTAAATANWLSVSPASGATPANLTLAVDATGLSEGTYQGSVLITAGTTPVSVPVTLTVGTTAVSSSITLTPSSASFSQLLGGTGPGPQTIQLSSTPAASFTAASTETWLTVTPTSGTTPANLSLRVDASGLPAGVYQGSITISGGTAPVAVPVTLTITGNGTNPITYSPLGVYLSQTSAYNGYDNQIVQLTAANPTSFAASSNATWLTVGPAAGVTPATLIISASAAGLGVGKFQASVTITGGVKPVSIPVVLTVTPPPNSISATPTSLSFAQTLGGPVPDTQTVQLVSPSATKFTVSSTVAWLSVTLANGATPAALTLQANAKGLAAGSYQGSITISGGLTPVSVSVTFTVTSMLALTPATLAFSADVGQAPAAQTVNVGSSGSQLSFAVAAAAGNGGTWLTVTPSLALAPAVLTVAVTTTGLAPGQYAGVITITPTDPSIPPEMVPVTLTVTASSGPPLSVGSIVNAASMLPGSIAPGEIIWIMGSGLGPAEGSGPNVLAAGAVDTQVADTRVLFDGIPAPLLFVSSDKINAIVPYEVSGRPGTNVQVEVSGVRTNPVSLQVVNTIPALFTMDGSGRGQAAIINQDGSANNATQPAARGSVICIYGTGEGQTLPAGQDGRIIATDVRTPIAPVSLTIGGVPVEVRYFGSAPGQVSGMFQINAYLPADFVTGDQLPIELTVGGAPSPAGVTAAIR
jgi:uncharacterized protein (TIGR03437 family)